MTRKYNLRPHIRFNTKVVSANWDSKLQHYEIIVEHVISGARLSTTANIIISAIGFLEQPRYPSGLSELELFKGELFHSARYRHDVELKGKRVGVIGNGCSAYIFSQVDKIYPDVPQFRCQIIPIISEDPSVTVVNFCRTPSWFLPRVWVPIILSHKYCLKL
jgi:lysine/ornithine N-monooxygenase